MKKNLVVSVVSLISATSIFASEGSLTQPLQTTRQRVRTAFDAFDSVDAQHLAQSRLAAAEEEILNAKKHVAISQTIADSQRTIENIALAFDTMDKALISAKGTLDTLLSEGDPTKIKAGLPKIASSLRAVVVDGQKPFQGSNRRALCDGTKHSALFTGIGNQADLVIGITRAESAKSKRAENLQQSDFDVQLQLHTTGLAETFWKKSLDVAVGIFENPTVFLTANFSCVLDGLTLVDISGKPIMSEFSGGKRLAFRFGAAASATIGYSAIISPENTLHSLPAREASYQPALAYADVLGWLADEAAKPLRKIDGFHDAFQNIAEKLGDDIGALGHEKDNLLLQIEEMKAHLESVIRY